MLPHQNTGAPIAQVAPAHSIVTRRADGEPVTTSMAIALGTKVQHKNVLELIRTHKASLGQFGSIAFETRDNPGAAPTEVAVLTEPQSALLIAFMRNTPVVVDFKVTLVREFYAMRAALKLQAGIAAPATMREALLLALAQEEKIERLELKQTADAPKVAFAEAVRALEGVCHVEKIAKTLGFGRNKFFKMLRADGILMNSNLPYQKYIDRDYFTVAEQEPYIDSKGVSHPTFTAMVTGAGQVFLSRKYAELETAS